MSGGVPGRGQWEIVGQAEQIAGRLSGLMAEIADLRYEIETLAASVSAWSPGAPPELLTVEQAASMLSIGRSTLFNIIADGSIDSVIIGKSRRVPRKAITEYIDRLAHAAKGLGDRRK